MFSSDHAFDPMPFGRDRSPVVWHCFDRSADVGISARNRPHWDQTGSVTFVTLRLNDSMPKAVLLRWFAEQDEWLKQRGVETKDREAALLAAPPHIQRAFKKFKLQRWHENLDNCHGRCLLRQPSIAKIVSESLLKFDNERYDLERFVIMPNHVHLLVQMRASWGLREQCESWMRFTARKINSLYGESGSFWAEPFDHIVRDEPQFAYLQEYIAQNPSKAHLAEQQYVLWIRGRG